MRDIAASLETWKDHLVTHLVVPAPGPENRHGAVILDQDGTLHQRFGATSECLYLIRTDKYVGLRSKPADLSVLQDYLKSIFVG